MVKTVHLIRHAQSQANVDGILCGQLDSPLSENGLEQVRAAAQGKWVRELTSLPCFTSNLIRTVDTARGLGFTKLVSIPELAETNTGDFSQKRFAEVAEQHPCFDHHRTDLHARYPGGETTMEMITRSWQAFCKIEQGAEQLTELVIVGHGGPLNSIVGNLLGVPFSSFPTFQFENAHITTLVRKTSQEASWCLTRMNIL